MCVHPAFDTEAQSLILSEPVFDKRHSAHGIPAGDNPPSFLSVLEAAALPSSLSQPSNFVLLGIMCLSVTYSIPFSFIFRCNNKKAPFARHFSWLPGIISPNESRGSVLQGHFAGEVWSTSPCKSIPSCSEWSRLSTPLRIEMCHQQIKVTTQNIFVLI